MAETKKSSDKPRFTKGPCPSTPRGWRRFNKLNDSEQKERRAKWIQVVEG